MGKTRPSRMGRPPLPKGRAKDIQLCFRVQPALYTALLKAANRADRPLAAWIRDTLAQCLGNE